MADATTNTNLRLEKAALNGEEYVVITQLIEWSSGKKDKNVIVLSPDNFEEMIERYWLLKEGGDRT